MIDTIIIRVKSFLARQFNLELALVEFGDQHYCRFVHYAQERDSSRRYPYVTIHGLVVKLNGDTINRDVVWLRSYLPIVLSEKRGESKVVNLHSRRKS